MNELVFLNYDISLILSCADRLSKNSISKFSLFAPEAYYKRSELNRIALESATNFNELYAALEAQDTNTFLTYSKTQMPSLR